MSVEDKIKSIIKDRIMTFDGATGTFLQAHGLPTGIAPEEWNLTKPEIIKDFHNEYVEAGVDFITTNTFGGSRLKLGEFGLDTKFKEINSRAVKIAKSVADNKAFVAGSIGPLGVMLEPLGLLNFDTAYREFYDQIEILKQSGVDIIIIETMTDVYELFTASLAASHLNIPFISNITLDEGTRTVTGTNTEAFIAKILPLKPLALGINCGNDPNNVTYAIKEIRKITNIPILAEPNAGIPEIVDGKTIFPQSPELFAQNSVHNIKAGANFIGGCCGSTPEHIKAMLKNIQDHTPETSSHTNISFMCSSRSKALLVNKSKTRFIGERINPAGRKKLKEEIRNNQLHLIRREGIKQDSAGADALDVCVAVPQVPEFPILTKAVKTLSINFSTPLFIDSNDLKALEESLKIYPGRAVVNSVTGKIKDMEKLLPLIAKYKAAFVGLPIDENGIPNTPEGRLEIAMKILSYAEKYGFTKNDILFDIVILPIGNNQDSAKIAIDTLRLYNQNELNSTAGVSNISFGLPQRSLINSHFLSQLILENIDTAIIDITDENIRTTIATSELLSGKDPKAGNFINSFTQKEKKPEQTNKDSLSFYELILNGETEIALSRIKEIMTEGQKPFEIINNDLIPAIINVGNRFEKKEIFLPVVISAASTVKKCIEYLTPLIDNSENTNKGTILLASVEGDIHDIGKNLVGTVLSSYGFEVIDLGKSVTTEQILSHIKSMSDAGNTPDAVGLSSLMTTTMSSMEQTTKNIKSEFPNIKIVIGGATTSHSFAEKIGADGYAKDAISGAKLLIDLLT